MPRLSDVQILESALFASVPPDTQELIEHLKAESSALKIALYESVTTLARAAAVTGGESLAAALPAFVTDGSAQPATASAPAPTASRVTSAQQVHDGRAVATPEDPPAA